MAGQPLDQVWIWKESWNVTWDQASFFAQQRKNSRKNLAKTQEKWRKTQGKSKIFTFSLKNEEICTTKSKIFGEKPMIFAGKLKNFTEKLKKFQKYSMSGRFIYSGCLYYCEKGSLQKRHLNGLTPEICPKWQTWAMLKFWGQCKWFSRVNVNTQCQCWPVVIAHRQCQWQFILINYLDFPQC